MGKPINGWDRWTDFTEIRRKVQLGQPRDEPIMANKLHGIYEHG
jgi:hypothetical protein